MKQIFGQSIAGVVLTSGVIGLFLPMEIAIKGQANMAIATEAVERVESSDRFLMQSLMGETPALDSSFKSGNPPNGLSRKTSLHRFPNLEDDRKYRSIIASFSPQNFTVNSKGEIIQQIAQKFIGAEYKAGLLDKLSQETLIISLKQFDCMLFIETVLAIASNLTQKNYGYQAFSQEVEAHRYWNGKMNGYCSRLHYFSDWIEDNQKRGRIKNITQQLGGVDITKKLNFMTTHRNSYTNLAKSDANFKCIASVEASLSDKFNYIPTKNIKQAYSQLQPGDIVGIATNIPGLDFTHTGLVYRQPNGNIGLIHASPAGKVVIAPDLQDYTSKVDRAIGIVVSRVIQ